MIATMNARTLFAVLVLVAGPAVAADDPPLDPSMLELASVHAAVGDLESGETLYRKNADRVVPIASITKVMTAMVVLDSGADPDEWLTIVEREHAAPNNAYTRLRRGSKARREDLLRIALMASENHAAYVLARHHPGGFDAFVEAMNTRAAELGMTNTRFAGPSGLSIGNRSSANDLLKMIRVAMDYSKIREFTGNTVHTVYFKAPRYRLRYGNTNVLAYRGHWHIALSKTGYLDEAGRCLVMATEIDGRSLGMVLLDSFGRRTPVGDAGRIRRWLEHGAGGSIAPAARRYEREQLRQIAAGNPMD